MSDIASRGTIRVTTHVLDTARGIPARGIRVLLDREEQDGTWIRLGEGLTNEDGRVTNLLPADDALGHSTLRLTFFTAAYFASTGDEPAFFPQVSILFRTAGSPHYHVPLLLSPFGYTTYRGS